MVNALGRNAGARARLTYRQTRQMYKTAVVGGLCTILLVLVMWLINIAGGKEVNYIFLFAGLAVIAIWAFSPKRILIAMGAGAIVQGLRDEDIPQGAVTGIKTLYQGTLGVMLWFAITAGMLSVLSFKESPASFFSIAAMLFILAITFVSIPSKFLRVVVAGVAVAVITYHGWQITPKEIKEKVESVAKSATSSPAKGVTSGPVSTQETAKWSETAKDGTLPVGVWSDWIPLDLDCRFRFQLDEKVTAEWRDAFGKERELKQGSKIDGVKAVRFQPRVAGLKEYPMKKICS